MSLSSLNGKLYQLGLVNCWRVSVTPGPPAIIFVLSDVLATEKHVAMQLLVYFQLL
jgi:hypothetical protein